MRVLFRFLAVLIAAMLLAAAAAGEEWYIRVIARDDSEAARQEKMRVAVAAMNALPRGSGEMLTYLPKVFAAAQKECDCRCSLRLWSPDEKTTPRLTCYIVVGSGEGHNWWGVLFPDSLRLFGVEDTEEPEARFTFPLLSRLSRLLFGDHPSL